MANAQTPCEFSENLFVIHAHIEWIVFFVIIILFTFSRLQAEGFENCRRNFFAMHGFLDRPENLGSEMKI